jgi:hypothetical protein
VSRIAAAYASDEAWVAGVLLAWGLLGILTTLRSPVA